jgi:hypothetical protein
MADPAALRAGLIALRHDALARLAEAEQIAPGYLALLADTDAALRMLDAEPVEPLADAAQAERLVVVGCDGEIKVVAYIASKAAAVVTLTPQRAIAIALDLLDLAHRRWPA